MRILGIETSCDETSAAVIEANTGDKMVNLLSNVVASSMQLHGKTGGIIPEVAAREQLKYILPVIDNALKTANGIGQRVNSSAEKNYTDIDAIAVTVGPGLIGSLLVGVETAKTLSYIWNKPIIPVNHLYGHIYANWIIANSIGQRANTSAEKNHKPLAISNMQNIVFPALALIVSGGHTDLVLLENHKKILWIAGTRDDAAGEAFDKIGRLLGLPYPAGPIIEKLAKQGNSQAFAFPRPLLHDKTFDFSFSGLKTAVLREVEKYYQKSQTTIPTADLARATQDAIIDVLVGKTLKAAEKYQVKSVLLGGGVAANETLVERFKLDAKRLMLDAKIFVPQKSLCTDNAAMIATAGFFNYEEKPWKDITANPELYFD